MSKGDYGRKSARVTERESGRATVNKKELITKEI